MNVVVDDLVVRCVFFDFGSGFGKWCVVLEVGMDFLFLVYDFLLFVEFDEEDEECVDWYDYYDWECCDGNDVVFMKGGEKIVFGGFGCGISGSDSELDYYVFFFFMIWFVFWLMGFYVFYDYFWGLFLNLLFELVVECVFYWGFVWVFGWIELGMVYK